MPSAAAVVKERDQRSEEQASAIGESPPNSVELIKAKFKQSPCLITISRTSTLVGDDKETQFVDLMKQLENIDSGSDKVVIWVLDRGFQNCSDRVQSFRRKEASKNFDDFQSVVIRAKGESCAKWLAERSYYFLANPSDALIENYCRNHKFDRHDFRSSKYDSSNFFF